MGTTLTGTQINNTYDGLIKTTDNTAITATTKLISDGLGNDTCIKVGTAGTDFLGNVDFSAATVTGLPAAAAGLVSGTGTDSMQSDASLTTTPANAAATDSIALGDGATVAATATNGIAIGVNATTSGAGADGQLAIGNGSVVSNNKGIAIGVNGTSVTNSEGLAIGDNVDISLSDRSIGIGVGINISGGSDKVAIGTSASVTGLRGLAFGQNASSTANEAIALGYNVTAANAQTVSVKALETQTASTPTAGGIIMTDAGSVARRLNITAAGALQIDSTPVGGGGGGTQSLVADATFTNTMLYNSGITFAGASTLGDYGIGIGGNAVTNCDSIAIGNGSGNCANVGTAVGRQAKTCEGSVALGNTTTALGACATSLGGGSVAGGAQSIAIGGGFTPLNTCAAAACSISIGTRAYSNSTDGISIGHLSCNAGSGQISIGCGANSGPFFEGAIAIGKGATSQYTGVSIGCGANGQDHGIAIGKLATAASASTSYTILLGRETCSTAAHGQAYGYQACAIAAAAIALGCSVTASRANTVTGCQMEACVAGKGIVVTSPDGLTTLGIGIDNTGAIVTYTP